MYLRDAKQKIMDFETKLEDYKAKLLMSYEASPVVLVTRKNGHVNMFLRCCLFQKIVRTFVYFLPMSTSCIAIFSCDEQVKK